MKKIFMLLTIMTSAVSFPILAHAAWEPSLDRCIKAWNSSSAAPGCHTDKVYNEGPYCVVEGAVCLTHRQNDGPRNPMQIYTYDSLAKLVNCNGKIKFDHC